MNELDVILEKYGLADILIGCHKYGNGHINETYLCETPDEKYIVQGVNKQVFAHPEKIIENILSLQHEVPENTILLDLLPCKQGQYFYDMEHYLWRVVPFAEGYTTYEKIEKPEVAYAVGSAYGNFLLTFEWVEAEELFPTIPNFHHAPLRYEALKHAYNQAATERKQTGKQWFDLIEQHKNIFFAFQEQYEQGIFPTRVTHNDTKINNVLIGEQDTSDVKVIDLDTVMAGTLLYDFGDMCRSAANTGGENTKNPEEISFDVEVFRQLTAGYSVIKNIITTVEKEHLVSSIQYMALMLASRFLADYFDGDKYFKTSFPEENLIRARNQILLFLDIEKKKEELEKIVEEYFDEE